MKNTKKNIFVLSAAGFSQAYLKYDGNELSSTTINKTLVNNTMFIKYYTCIYGNPPPESILTIQNLYKRVWDVLDNKEICSNTIYPPNFETVFYILDFLAQMHNPDKLLEGEGEEKNKSHHSFFLPKLFTSIKDDWNEEFSIVDFYHFKNFLLAYVSKFKAEEEDLRNIYTFINKLKDKYHLRYYTLNYDNLFLKAVGMEYSSSKMPDDINFGHNTSKNNNIVASNILKENDCSKLFSKHYQHCCFHLHGSVNYGIGYHTCTFHENEAEALESRKKYVTEELNTGAVRDWTSFIVGYDKDKIMNLEPYSSFHLQMARDIIDAEEVLVLGYAFNDEHINKWLLRLTAQLNTKKFDVSKVKKITVVDCKSDEAQKQAYRDNFLTIARSSGERKQNKGYSELNAKKIDGLEFEFDGVDSYIKQYIKC